MRLLSKKIFKANKEMHIEWFFKQFSDQRVRQLEEEIEAFKKQTKSEFERKDREIESLANEKNALDSER